LSISVRLPKVHSPVQNNRLRPSPGARHVIFLLLLSLPYEEIRDIIIGSKKGKGCENSSNFLLAKAINVVVEKSKPGCRKSSICTHVYLYTLLSPSWYGF
jgi:hypothetical protein